MNYFEIEMDFGIRLKQERNRLGLSQAALAASINMKPWAILQYEKGKLLPSLKTVYAFERVGMNIKYLVTGNKFSIDHTSFPPAVFKAVGETIQSLDTLFAEDGGLTAGAKAKVTLMLLQRFSEIEANETQPSLLSLLKSLISDGLELKYD